MTGFLSAVAVLVALSQAPESPRAAAVLNALPANVPIAVHVRGFQNAHDDLAAMLEAMSPRSVGHVLAPLDQALEQLKERYGPQASQKPMYILIDFPEGAEQEPPFAVALEVADYAAVQKAAVGGGEFTAKRQPGGYDRVDGGDRSTTFTARLDGLVALSTNERLIGSLARPKTSLGKTLDAELQTLFDKGDISFYLDLADLRRRFPEILDALRGSLDTSARDVGGEGRAEASQAAVARLFEAIDASRALVISLDFDPEAGLHIAGQVTVETGSKAAKELAEAKTGSATQLEAMPANATFASYVNTDAETAELLARAQLTMLLGSFNGENADFRKASGLLQSAGRIESTRATLRGKSGLHWLVIDRSRDPGKLEAAMVASLRGLAPGKAPRTSYVQDVRVENATQKYQGFTLHHATLKLDLKKMAADRPNSSGGADAVRSLAGGDSISIWFGTNGTDFLQVAAPTWDEARPLIDNYLAKKNSLGEVPAFRSLRSRFPEQVGSLTIMNAREAVRLFEERLETIAPGESKKSAQPNEADSSKHALVGIATVAGPAGVRFLVDVPREAGPVLEDAVLPLVGRAKLKVSK